MVVGNLMIAFSSNQKAIIKRKCKRGGWEFFHSRPAQFAEEMFLEEESGHFLGSLFFWIKSLGGW